MNPSRQQLSPDAEVAVATFSFDESQSIDDNLELFFDHVATYDREFAGFLKTRLPTVLASNDRSIFNAALIPVLDAPPPPPPPPSPPKSA